MLVFVSQDMVQMGYIVLKIRTEQCSVTHLDTLDVQILLPYPIYNETCKPDFTVFRGCDARPGLGSFSWTV